MTADLGDRTVPVTVKPGRPGYWMPLELRPGSADDGSSVPDALQARLRRLAEENPQLAIRLAPDWVIVRPRNTTLPGQGWKLHVSATVTSAVEVFNRAAPTLVSSGTPFKAAASLAFLSLLNGGRASGTQVGKFLTAYPSCAEAAREVAEVLHAATAGLDGPVILSDRPFRPGSLVYYRYGSFVEQTVLGPLSSVRPALCDPSGRLVEDERRPGFAPPGVRDPFASSPPSPAWTAAPSTQSAGPIGKRYRVKKALYQSSKGGVYLVDDHTHTPPVTRVMKEARRHTVTDALGRDARARLGHEGGILRKLALPWTPAVFDWFQQGGNSYLVMEYIGGRSLRSFLRERTLHGEVLGPDEVATVGGTLVRIIVEFHRQGIILRDLTPDNLIIETSESLKVIDLELAHDPTTGDPPFPGWSHGYCRPGEPPSPATDYYALGGCLFFLATGVDPVLPEDGRPLIDRQLCLLRRLRTDLPVGLVALIGGLLALDPDHRLTDPVVVQDALERVKVEEPSPPPHPPPPFPPTQDRCEVSGPEAYLAIASGVGRWLLEHLEPERSDWLWPPSAGGLGYLPISLHSGAAGVGLFLAETYRATADRAFLEAAEEAAAWCERWGDTHSHLKAPGLWFGHAGVAWLHVRLAELTGDGRHMEVSSDYARAIDRMPCSYLDLAHGLAGVGLMHLALARETRIPYHHRRALEIADSLLESARPYGRGLIWPLTLGGADPRFGLAHGAAGIGLFLAETAALTGQSSYLRGADAAADTLLDSALGGRDGNGGWLWAQAPGDARLSIDWHSGSSGIGSFFIRLFHQTQREEHLGAARRAAEASWRGAKPSGSSVWRGVPGVCHFLLDMYRATGDNCYLHQATELGQVLIILAGRSGDTMLWWTDRLSQVDADLMGGNSGVGMLFLRLADPGTPGMSPARAHYRPFPPT